MWRAVDDRHRKYKCRVCGKADRKSRSIAHVLKYHVSLDRVPYSCSLCNFRCMEENELMNHVKKYQRHVKKVSKLGFPDSKILLNKAENPIDIQTLIEAVDEPGKPVNAVLPQATNNHGPVSGLELFRAMTGRQASSRAIHEGPWATKPATITPTQPSAFVSIAGQKEGTKTNSFALSSEPGWTTNPQIDQYDAPTPLMDEHVEGEEEFNEWLVSLVATDDQKTVTHEKPNQQVPSLTPDEQRDARSPMLLTATPEQEIVVSPTMSASPDTSAVVQDAMVDAIRQSTIQMVNAIREGQSSILSAINAKHRDMLNVLKEIRDALKKIT
ncbi:hypothetical protein DPMN_025067 [Dreissena polymorpha]|uniref:C2H2-type domain-containing protein n=1 Tax=Dreissena polymorpha TaxID=45954 RepID=A0A9D4LQP8_DREPO|nr:hypothetical protein DPMN_025067 [Dreissena polymorpha]